jgi:hypothetical protein
MGISLYTGTHRKDNMYKMEMQGKRWLSTFRSMRRYSTSRETPSSWLTASEESLALKTSSNVMDILREPDGGVRLLFLYCFVTW